MPHNASPGHDVRPPAAVDDASSVFVGDGEMATRCRALDWSATPLGPVRDWPAALRIGVRLMLATPVATSLWCGPSYTLIYNDAYRGILNAKHPMALGRSGAAVWEELWPALERQFAQVRSGGPPVFEDEALLTMKRLDDGRAEDAWFTYSLSALTDDTGMCVAVYNVAVETTTRVRARAAVEQERNRLFEASRLAPSFVCMVRGPEHVFEYANEAYLRLVGRRDILGQPVWEALPEARGQGFEALLDGVLKTGVPFVGREVPLRLARTPGLPPEERFVDFLYQALIDGDGARIGVIVHGTDVTEQVRARREVERLLAVSESTRATLESRRVELERSNEQLQEQSVELEAQAEELQVATEELAERTDAAEIARRQAEAAEAQLQTVFAQAPVAVCVTAGPEHRYVLVNSRYEQLVGRAVRVGTTFREALPEIAPQGFEALLDRVYATAEPFVAHEERVLIDRGGPTPDEGWYDFVYQPLTDAGGAVTGVMQLAVEVTAQVRARHDVELVNEQLQNNAAELEAQAEELASANEALAARTLEAESGARRAHFAGDVGRAITAGGTLAEMTQRCCQAAVDHLDAAFCRVWVLDAEAQVLVMTASAGKYTHLDGAHGRVPVGAFKIGQIAAERRPHVTNGVVGDPRVNDQDWARREGMVSFAGHPLIVGDETVGVIAMFARRPLSDVDADAFGTGATAISVAVRNVGLLESERHARGVAEEANQAKSQFLTTMSHELRTPLNAIGGYVQLMDQGIRGPVTPEQQGDLKRVLRAQRHLLGLINGVLDYAKVDAGMVGFASEPVPMEEVLATCEALVAPQARERRITLDLDARTAPFAALADREKVQQVVLNLLSNAVKFTAPEGRVSLSCEIVEHRVVLRVTDTGRGIATDQLERVFQPFVQIDAKLTRASEGTGLGLAISRDLARGMGGDLVATSTLGEGSIFTLTLPAA